MEGKEPRAGESPGAAEGGNPGPGEEEEAPPNAGETNEAPEERPEDSEAAESSGPDAWQLSSGIKDQVLEKLAGLLGQDLSKLDLGDVGLEDGLTGRAAILKSFDVDGVAKYIKENKVKKIVVMCGAGISVSAGIPDFRTPGTGLYDNLQKYNLPHPQAVFELDYFRKNPRPFYLLAREMFPGGYSPTPAHYFIRLLHDKGLLLRCYTQNIDSLESQAGLPSSALVAAHGNFDTASCISCRKKFTQAFAKEAVMAGEPAKCEKCGSLVKPDIVFFGESLPDRFFQCCQSDLRGADLLIVMGTSLQVQPFASLMNMVGDDVPRLLINRERAGESCGNVFGMPREGFNFDDGNYRDALYLGDSDDGVKALAEHLGWGNDLDNLCRGTG